LQRIVFLENSDYFKFLEILEEASLNYKKPMNVYLDFIKKRHDLDSV